MREIDGVEVPVGTLDITLYRDDLSTVARTAGVAIERYRHSPWTANI